MVFDETDCVYTAQKWSEFCAHESCGKSLLPRGHLSGICVGLRLRKVWSMDVSTRGYCGPVTNVLGISVSTSLLKRWREWFAPAAQPFRTDRLCERFADGAPTGRRLEPSAEVRDTFHMYGGTWVWLEEPEFVQLSRAVRRALLFRRKATGRLGRLTTSPRHLIDSRQTDSRIVWWPSLLHRVGDEPLLTYVEESVRPSRHREVDPTVWSAARHPLPGAADLTGTFAPASGPNCFGTVMAAAGVPGAESEWMVQGPFENWLAEHTVPIQGTATDHAPGVVLVWRAADGLAAHAAVTVGNGFALSKPSQAWCSPRLVWTVRETVRGTRYPGLTLSRHLIGGQ